MTINQHLAHAVFTAARSPINFTHEGQSHPISTARDTEGRTWWVARDVCEALGITKKSRALERVNATDKGRTKLSTPGGLQNFVTVNESGLYALAFHSRKPAARAFQHWVTSTVLPAIAEDGAYIRGEEHAQHASTVGELTARREALQATANQAIEAKAQRGFNALEERDARHTALKLLGAGRRRSRSRPRLLTIGRDA